MHGLPGRNIYCDLHNEHLNRVCKNSISGLGSNNTDKTIERIGRFLCSTVRILEVFDKNTDVPIHNLADTLFDPRLKTDKSWLHYCIELKCFLVFLVGNTHISQTIKKTQQESTPMKFFYNGAGNDLIYLLHIIKFTIYINFQV